MKRNALTRVEVAYAYATYVFNVFRDKASEASGASWFMAHAVPCHIPLSERSKPASWITVMVAETVSGQSSSVNAAMEKAYFDKLFERLRQLRQVGLKVEACWHTDAPDPMPVMLLPALHALVEDDPQQKATCCCSGCVWCTQPNAIAASSTHPRCERTEANTRVTIEQALAAVESGQSSRSRDVRAAKASVEYIGVRWPPRVPYTFTPDPAPGLGMLQRDDDPTLGGLTTSGAFWVQNYATLHNVGLCMIPDCMQIAVQLTFDSAVGGRVTDWNALLSGRAKDYVLANFSDWSISRGRCKTKGLGGALLRFEGGRDKQGHAKLPRVRRSSKYELMNAMRFFRILFHTELAQSHPAAAKALLKLVETIRLVKRPTGLVDSERGELRAAVVELLGLVQTAAVLPSSGRRIKDLNRAHNWHKNLHVARIMEWLGSVGEDEHGVAAKAPSSRLSAIFEQATGCEVRPNRPACTMDLTQCRGPIRQTSSRHGPRRLCSRSRIRVATDTRKAARA